MITITLLLLLLSNSITLRRDKSILCSRITIAILVISTLITYDDLNLLLALHNSYQEKDSVFECGFHLFLGQNRTQFSVSFFIFALLTLGFIFKLGKNALSMDGKQTSLFDNPGISIYVFYSMPLKSGFVSDSANSGKKPDKGKRKATQEENEEFERRENKWEYAEEEENKLVQIEKDRKFAEDLQRMEEEEYFQRKEYEEEEDLQRKEDEEFRESFNIKRDIERREAKGIINKKEQELLEDIDEENKNELRNEINKLKKEYNIDSDDTESDDAESDDGTESEYETESEYDKPGPSKRTKTSHDYYGEDSYKNIVFIIRSSFFKFLPMFTFSLGFSILFFMPDVFPYLFYILPEFKVYFYEIYTTILVLQICNLIRKS
jgi:NADH-ubiquinone oxidoreductase chain 3